MNRHLHHETSKEELQAEIERLKSNLGGANTLIEMQRDKLNAICKAITDASPNQSFDPEQVVHHVKAIIAERNDLEGRLDSAEAVIDDLQSQLGF